MGTENREHKDSLFVDLFYEVNCTMHCMIRHIRMKASSGR